MPSHGTLRAAGGGGEKLVTHFFEIQVGYGAMHAVLNQAEAGFKKFGQGAGQAITGLSATGQASLGALNKEFDKATATALKYSTALEAVRAKMVTTSTVTDEAAAKIKLLTNENIMLTATLDAENKKMAEGEVLGRTRQKNYDNLTAKIAANRAAIAALTEANTVEVAVDDKLIAKEAELAAAYKAAADAAAGAQAKITAANTSSLGKRAAGVGDMIGGAAMAIPLFGAVIAGATTLLDKLTVSTANFAAQIERETLLLNGNSGDLQHNSDMLQFMYSAGLSVGVSTDKMSIMLQKFQQNLARMSDTELANAGITTRQFTPALEQYIAAVQRASPEVAALNTRLLMAGGSSSGADVLNKIFRQGMPWVTGYMNQLKEMGVIMDQGQLSALAFADAIHNQMDLQLKGVGNTISAAVAPAFTVLWAVIGIAFKKIEGGASAVAGFLVNAAIALVVFVAALFGATITMGDVLDALAGVNTSLQGISDNSQTAADGMGAMAGPNAALAAGAKAQTDAIKDQIAVIDLQIKAQQDLLKGAQDQLAANDLLQQQQDEMHQSYLSSLQDQLTTSQDAGNAMRHSGENLVDYQRRMYQQDLQTKINTENDKRALVKTNAEIAIEQIKDQTAAQIASYNTEKAALNDQLSAITSANSAATASGLAMDTALSGGSFQAANFVKSLIANVDPGITGAAQGAEKGFTKSIQDMRTSLQGFSDDIKNTIQWIGVMGEVLSAAPPVFGAMGDIAQGKWGDAIATLGGDYVAQNAARDAAAQQLAALVGAATGQASSLPVPHADGEIHTRDHLAFVHRNEVTIPLGQTARAQQLADASGLSSVLGGRGGGVQNSFVTHYNGPVADALVASRVADRFVQEAHRKGLQFVGVH